MGGIERIVIDKINYLANQENYQVTVAYFGSEQTIPFYQIDERVKRKAVSSGYWGRSIKKRILILYKIGKQVKRIIEETTPDIIVNAMMPLVSWSLPIMNRDIPKIVELHMSRVGKQLLDKEIFGKRRLVNKAIDFLRARFYALYDKCVVLTNDGLREYNLKNAIVIPNFTNLHFPVIDKIKKEKIVINVGRLSHEKNQELLINAWKIVKKKAPSWRLEIWGNGDLKENLENQIQSLGLEGVVKLMGVFNHIEDVYCHASFFVLSSRHEGQGIVLIEALQAGLPCVSLSVNGVHDTIKNDYNGYIVEKSTPEALAEGILKMISCDHRELLSKNAQESAKVFDKERVMAIWISLFENLTNGQHH